MRLVTRSDFDGLACAVLLEDIGAISDYMFVHPKDVQDGVIEVTKDDVLANVPYVAGCGMWFDHHTSEDQRLNVEGMSFEGSYKVAPSCARVIYDYYNGPEKFKKYDDSGLMWAVDKSDSADFSVDEILKPEGWVLLSYIMDARTGLGRFRDYRISNLELMRDMIGYCRNMTVDQILAVPDVQERIKRYFEQEGPYEEMIKSSSKADGNVLIIDLRGVDEILSGNRFVEYAMFPEQNVSLRVIWGKQKQNVVFTVGHSIVNRSCKTDVGSLMLKNGGGGHQKVGTCQVPEKSADKVYKELLNTLKANG